MFKNVQSANRTKYNTKRRLESFIYWKYQENYSRKSASILLDYYYNQKKKILLWLL